jgi:L-seryl-tRNA(Ser) seleniumtransferase
MSVNPNPAAEEWPGDSDRLRALPSVEDLLNRPALAALSIKAGRGIVTRQARSVLAGIRSDWKAPRRAARDLPDLAVMEGRIIHAVEALLAPSLQSAVNATGVILHTNLGRAPLSAEAVAAIAKTAGGYSNLEYDLASGERGKRDVHTAKLLAELTGAENSIVVNNNAAAVFLVLNTLAKGSEVLVSRGELIEIGDGFRIPDIMSESGAVLREVGATNRTRIRDYEGAITERTCLLLRVHPSNFRITGFTDRPSLHELVALGQRRQLPVYEDLGSGCLANLAANGVAEPVVRSSSEAGVSVLSFSGDKLLGGPQAGIIAGQKEIIERIRRNPLFRALRVDKLTIAAMEVTLRAYQRGAFEEIPTLRMIQLSSEEIYRRAAQFIEQITTLLPEDATVDLRDGYSVIGGGSTPDQQLPTYLIRIASRRHSAATLEESLRKPESGVAIVARIADDRVVLDLRTVFPEEEAALGRALVHALGSG